MTTRKVIYFVVHPSRVEWDRGHFGVEVHTLWWEVEYPDDEGEISWMLPCGGVGSKTIRMDNLKTSKNLPMSWT